MNDIFLDVINVLTPPKTKILPGNDTTFVDKQHRKDIYTLSKLKTKIQKPFKRKQMDYKKQKKHLYISVQKMYEKLPENLTEKGFSTNKSFRKFKKPFLTNKCFIGNNDITLIHKNTIISDQK